MTVMPPLSPWPAPKLADAAVQPAPPTADPAIEPPPQRHPVAELIGTARRLSSRAERAERAALKEELRIQLDLADLPVGWFVLHSPDLGEFEGQLRHADHVVIGPGGVYAIHLQHQLGAKVWVSENSLTIDGRDSDLLRSTRFDARRLGGMLSEACGFNVIVQCVIVLIGAATVQTMSRSVEVHVRTQHDLRDWLCKQPARLDSEPARTIHDHLCAAATPLADPAVGPPG